MEPATIIRELKSVRVAIAQHESVLTGLKARVCVLEEMLEEYCTVSHPQVPRDQFQFQRTPQTPQTPRDDCLDAALKRQQEAGARGRPSQHCGNPTHLNRLPSVSAQAQVDQAALEEDRIAWEMHNAAKEQASLDLAKRLAADEDSRELAASFAQEDAHARLAAKEQASRALAEDTEDLIAALTANESELKRVSAPWNHPNAFN